MSITLYFLFTVTNVCIVCYAPETFAKDIMKGHLNSQL